MKYTLEVSKSSVILYDESNNQVNEASSYVSSNEQRTLVLKKALDYVPDGASLEFITI